MRTCLIALALLFCPVPCDASLATNIEIALLFAFVLIGAATLATRNVQQRTRVALF